MTGAVEPGPALFIIEFDGDVGDDGGARVGVEFIKLIGGVGIGEGHGEDDGVVVRGEAWRADCVVDVGSAAI